MNRTLFYCVSLLTANFSVSKFWGVTTPPNLHYLSCVTTLFTFLVDTWIWTEASNHQLSQVSPQKGALKEGPKEKGSDPRDLWEEGQQWIDHWLDSIFIPRRQGWILKSRHHSMSSPCLIKPSYYVQEEHLINKNMHLGYLWGKYHSSGHQIPNKLPYYFFYGGDEGINTLTYTASSDSILCFDFGPWMLFWGVRMFGF